jgi:ABC-type polysaccharide/polyol phosphate transport system ATPase subunit
LNDLQPAIQVCNVTKKFRIYLERNATLKDKILYAGRSRSRDFVALDNVSLDIPRGATVGLLGVNGSGKSTLLKLMSRILYPDSGSIKVNGRVSSLLELGAGFHPDFTGRENVFMNGALFGLTKKEVQRRLGEIIDFSELADFIDQPVRSYSSGMYMRLAFSVAIAVDPEIILIDEILAVGDAPFQQKCLGKIKQLKSLNKTIVMVTHDMSAVTQFCDEAVWIHNSRIQRKGEPTECIRDYIDCAFAESYKRKECNNESPINISLNENNENQPDGLFWANAQNESVNKELSNHQLIRKVVVASASDSGIVRCGEPLAIKINLLSEKILSDAVITCQMFNEANLLCCSVTTLTREPNGLKIPEGISIFVLDIQQFLLTGGEYRMNVEISSVDGKPYDFWKMESAVRVISDIYDAGICRIPCDWVIDGTC